MFGSSLAEISQWNMHEEPDDNAALQQQVHIPKLTALPCLSLSHWFRLSVLDQLSDEQRGAAIVSEVTEMSRQIQGLILLGIGLTFVSVANVLTEYLYKRTGRVPLHKQNTLLYSCGVCFNAVAYQLFASSHTTGFFGGYSAWTLLVIMSQGVSGYLVGALFKYLLRTTLMQTARIY